MQKLRMGGVFSPENFARFTYARHSHWELFEPYSIDLFGEVLNPLDVDLKRYQDLLAYAFIKENVPPGSKIAEVGGGVSRLLKKMSDEYECWNIDKLEGVGNGPKAVNLPNVRMVRDYVGNFNTELPDNYFDMVFSISVLEHVPQDDERFFKRIVYDIQRILKSGGLSFHLFDVVVKGDVFSRCNKFINYVFDHVDTINDFLPIEAAISEGDMYFLPQEVYDRVWKKYTKKEYNEFGMPTSINTVWRK